MMLTDRQQLAVDHHCRLGAETVHPRFARRDLIHSSVLTVNSGYE